MVPERHRSFDVIVDGAGDADNLNPESFVHGPGASEASVAAQDHDRSVVQIGLEIPHRRLLHALFLEIFESAAADRAARVTAHAARIFLGDGFDPIVREPEEPMADEMHFEAVALSGDPNFFERGAGAGEISSRHERHDPFDLAGLQRHALFPHPLERHPVFPRRPLPFRQPHCRRIAGQAALFVGQEHDVVLTFLVVAEFGEGLMKGTRIQINHQRSKG